MTNPVKTPDSQMNTPTGGAAALKVRGGFLNQTAASSHAMVLMYRGAPDLYVAPDNDPRGRSNINDGVGGWWAVYARSSADLQAARAVESGGEAPGGTIGGGMGGGATAGAAAAAQAGIPNITGGGVSFEAGIVNVRAIMQERADEFMGLDTLTPPDRLPGSYTDVCWNWDDRRRLGSRCKRMGMAKLADDRYSVRDGSNNPINAAYRGNSVVALPADGQEADQLMYNFADAKIGLTRASFATRQHIVTTQPKWGRPLNLEGVPGPYVALTQQATTKIRVNVAYYLGNQPVFDQNTRAGLRHQSARAVVIRYSSINYPEDIDGRDGTSSVELQGRSTAWDGDAIAPDTTDLGTGTFYVAVWALGIEPNSISNRSLARIALT